ncbi:PhzF family phenazine biosynthesis protein [Streptomyces zingiberis]|uniref:PhzF family phenazine biosynthesis protein n=1 Tax=Streptomyces zingiberis TaxID=2053010 RepID=A0ABX1C4U9_9ACTN|nr:PhzF family phenazine biosynthesis isomerase [Streptomyces zingiberis]NJQ03821.1 PhzF family phenazine biosynthesis protein [Streptomyces zingiberis]
MRYPFETVGIFGARPGGGSPLAVVHDADGLGVPAMERIAAGLRVDETVFVLSPTAPGATHRVRVFTARGESPFGGHSAVGTAVALVRSGRLAPGRVVQQCGEKLLELDAGPDEAVVTASGALPCEELAAGPLLRAAGLAPADLGGGPPLAAGFGPRFHLLPVRRKAVGAARADEAAMRREGLPDLFVFHWDATTRTATARLFAPGYAIPEDPACASAALGLGVWLAAHHGSAEVRTRGAAGGPAHGLPGEPPGGLTDELPGGRLDFRVGQGAELGRPSVLRCSVTLGDGDGDGDGDGGRDGALTVTVGGRAPRELAGEFTVGEEPGR